MQNLKEKLITWIEEFIETPHDNLDNWAPCPYARSARINNKIYINEQGNESMLYDIMDAIDLLETYEVVVVCYDHNKFTPNAFSKFVKFANDWFKRDNIVILEDHPGDPEYVNGVKMNFGYCALLLIQKLDKLTEASEQLKSKGYYNVWSKESLDSVVNWRTDK
jgi:hypothetical protein